MSDSDAAAAQSASFKGGYVVASSLPLIVMLRACCSVWLLSFVVFFAMCRRQDEADSLVMLRKVTESWLSPLYTGHVAVDAFLVLSGALLGRQLATAVRTNGGTSQPPCVVVAAALR